jgi:hypothetical protein
VAFLRFRKTNNRAVAGFILPLVAMGAASALVLWDRAHGLPVPVWAVLLIMVPVLSAGGLFLCIRSIPFIHDLGDKDYAYSGIFINIFVILLFICSVFYYIFRVAE